MRKLLYILLTLQIGSGAFSQSITPFTINISGGTYENQASYSRFFDWSAGELCLVSTVATSDSSAVVYQGVLQPGTEKPGFTPFSPDIKPEDFKLFPNPTTGKFEINFFLNERGRMDIELTDALGKVMERRSVNYGGCCRIVQYDIGKLPAGVYFVVVTLQPDPATSLNTRQLPRRSALRVVKMNP